VVVNPTRVRNFARAKGQLAKTDQIDARMIADFAQTICPEVRSLNSDDQQLIKALVTRRRQLIDMQTAEKNRRSSINPELLPRLEKHLASCEVPAPAKAWGGNPFTSHSVDARPREHDTNI
jgi:transposase